MVLPPLCFIDPWHDIQSFFSIHEIRVLRMTSRELFREFPYTTEDVMKCCQNFLTESRRQSMYTNRWMKCALFKKVMGKAIVYRRVIQNGSPKLAVVIENKLETYHRDYREGVLFKQMWLGEIPLPLRGSFDRIYLSIPSSS